MAIEKIFVPYRPGNADKYILCKIDVTYYDKLDFSGEIEGANVDPPDTENGKPADTESEKPPDTESVFYSNILHSYFDKYNKQKGHFKCVIEPRDGSPTEIVLNEDTPSALLGVFLQSLHVANNWSYKDTWGSITVTGTFVDKDNYKGVLALAAIKDYQYKFKGEFKEYAEEHTDGKPHLFLYISNDKSLENESTENIQVKAFSPDQDTVFDVLDYVFKLPTFPPEFVDIERNRIVKKFNEEAKFAAPINNYYVKPGDYTALRSSLRADESGKNFFFYGTGGSGKTAMSIQIAMDMLWNDKIYAPIIIRIDPTEIMNIFAGHSTIKPQDYLALKFAEYFEVAPNLSTRRCFIIIDNLDMPEESIDQFLRLSRAFFENFTTSIFIFTSRTRIVSPDVGSLDLTVRSMLSFSSEKETEAFFISVNIGQDYYETKIRPKLETVEYKRFIEELHKKMHDMPLMISTFSRRLRSVSVDLAYLTEELKKNEFAGEQQETINAIYAKYFEEHKDDKNNGLSEDAKILIFFMCCHGITHRWTFEELESWVSKRTSRWKYDMEKLRSALDELSYFLFIHETVSEDKVVRFFMKSITYTTILFEHPFSANGLREKIIGPRFMLVEALFYNAPKEIIKNCLELMDKIDEPHTIVVDSRGHDMFEENKNPLLLAVSYHNDPAVVDVILKKHPEWYRPDDIGMTPLHYGALYSNSREIIDKLLDINSCLQDKDFGIVTYDNGFSVIHMAAQNARHEIIKILLDYIGARGMSYLLEQNSKHGSSPLHSAAACNINPVVIEELLRHGADVNRPGGDSWTALHVAAGQNPEPEVIETLIRFGADINCRNCYKQTPLIMAILKNQNDNVYKKLLSYKNIDINALTDKGQSALFLAVDLNKIDCVRILLDRSALVNQQNKWGDTPLHCAAARDFSEIVKLLLSHGADQSIKNIHEFTPLNIAIANNNVNMVKLLLSYNR